MFANTFIYIRENDLHYAVENIQHDQVERTKIKMTKRISLLL